MADRVRPTRHPCNRLVARAAPWLRNPLAQAYSGWDMTPLLKSPTAPGTTCRTFLALAIIAVLASTLMLAATPAEAEAPRRVPIGNEVAVWLMDFEDHHPGGAGITADISGNGYHLTDSSRGFRTGEDPTFGEGYEFFSNYYQLTQNHGVFLKLGDISIMAAFDLGNTAPGVLVSHGRSDFAGSEANDAYRISILSGGYLKYSHEYGTQTEYSVTSTTPLSTGSHVLTLRRDAAARSVDIHVDGAPFLGGTWSTSQAPTGGGQGDLNIGNSFHGETPFRGVITEFRFWDQLVSQATLDDLTDPDDMVVHACVDFAAADRVPHGGEVAMWRFDAADPTSDVHGLYPLQVNTGPVHVTGAHVDYGDGYDMDGGGSLTQVHGAFWKTGDISALLAIDRGNTWEPQTLFVHEGTAAASYHNAIYGLDIDTSGTLHYYHEYGTRQRFTASSTIPVSSSGIVYTLVRDVSERLVQVFVDGERVLWAQWPAGQDPSGGGQGDLWLGNSADGTRHLRGTLLEARFWDRALSPDELNAYANGQVAPLRHLNATVYDVDSDGNGDPLWTGLTGDDGCITSSPVDRANNDEGGDRDIRVLFDFDGPYFDVAGIDDGTTTMTIDPGTSYWVDPGRHLAGGSPGMERAGRLTAYLHSGVDFALDNGVDPDLLTQLYASPNQADLRVVVDDTPACGSGPSCFIRSLPPSGRPHIMLHTTNVTPDIVGHEFGHYVMWRLGALPESSSSHFMCQTNLTPSLALSEGHADFTGAWVNHTYPGGRGGRSSHSFDLESPGGCDPQPTNQESEYVVAATFWDFVDAKDDGLDTYSFPHSIIVDVQTQCGVHTSMKSFYSDASCSLYTRHPEAMCAFRAAAEQNAPGMDWNLPPKLSNSLPAKSAYVRGTFSISIDAVDECGTVDSVRFGVAAGTCGTNSPAWTDTDYDGSDGWSLPFDSTALPDGRICLSANAFSDVKQESTNWEVNLDNTLPVTDVTLPDGSPVPAEVPGGTAVRGHCTDANVAPFGFSYTLNGATTSVASPPADIDLGADGEKTLVLECTDKAGNTGNSTHLIRVDSVPPTVTLTANGTQSPTGWYTSSVTVTISCTDPPGDPCDAVEYVLDGGARTDYSGPILFAQDGDHDVQGFGRDGAGNEGNESLTIQIDATAPITSLTMPNGSAVPAVVAGGTIVHGHCTETNRVAFSYNLNGVTTQAQESPVEIALEGDGEQTIVLDCADAATNTGNSTHTVTTDSTAPTVTLTPTGTSSNDWYTGDVLVSLSCMDANPPCSDLEYAIDGGARIAYSEPGFTFTDDGAYFIEGYGQDPFGHEGNDSLSIQIDATDPVTSLTMPDGSAVPPVVAGGTVVHGHCAEANRVSFSYTLDGVTTQAPDSPVAITLEGDMEHSLLLDCTDEAGHTGNSTHTITTDSTPPTLQLDATGPLGTPGWFTGSVEVSLICADANPPCNGLEYSFNGGARTPYTDPGFTLSEDGAYLIEGFGQDSFGHEGNDSLTVRIDATAPVTSLTLPDGSAVPAVVAGGTIVHAHCAEVNRAGFSYALNGVMTQAQDSPVPITLEGDGAQDLFLECGDEAGNTDNSTHTVTTDSTAPTLAWTATGSTGDDGWFTGEALLALSCTDANPPCNTLEYRIDGGVRTAYADPGFSLAEDGEYFVEGFGRDAFGHEGNASRLVRIDATAPVTSLTLPDGSPVPSVVAGGTIVQGHCTETNRAAFSYTLNGVTTQAQDSPVAITLEGDGEQSLVLDCADEAGNEGDSMHTVTTDSIAPVVQVEAMGPAGSPDWYVGAITVTVTCTDANPCMLEYAIDGGSRIPYTGPFTLETEGIHTIDGFGQDSTGHNGTGGLVVKIDGTAPTVTLARSGPIGLGGWFTGPVDVSLSCIDAHSACEGLDYAVDGGNRITYAGPGFTLSVDGKYVVDGYGDDAAGNEGSDAVDVWIDATEPVTLLSMSDGSPVPDVVAGGTTLHAQCTEANWGSFSYTLNGVTTPAASSPAVVVVTGDGPQALTLECIDAAGNAGSSMHAVTTDSTSPLIQLDVTGPTGQGDWFTGPVEITLMCTDVNPPCSTLEYRVDEGPRTSYVEGFALSADGEYIVNGYGRDAFGHEGTASRVVRIDAAAPVASIKMPDESPVPPVVAGGTVVHGYCADANLAAMSYTLNGVTTEVVSSPVEVTLLGDSAQVLVMECVDGAGNTGSVARNVTTDSTAPAIELASTGPVGANGWHKGPVRVTMTCTDRPGTTCTSSEYRIDDDARTAYLSPGFDILADGEYVVTGFGRDDVGHEGIGSLVVKIDAVAPIASVSSPAESKTNNAFTVTVTGSDATSGLQCILVESHDGTTWTTFRSCANPGTYTFVGSPGVLYSFRATATDVAGNQGAASSESSTYVNQPPKADAGPDKETTHVDNQLNGVWIDASGSSDADGNVTLVCFNWGDGSPSECGTAFTATHKYPLPPVGSMADQVYIVRVTVGDDDGRSHSDTATVRLGYV